MDLCPQNSLLLDFLSWLMAPPTIRFPKTWDPPISQVWLILSPEQHSHLDTSLLSQLPLAWPKSQYVHLDLQSTTYRPNSYYLALNRESLPWLRSWQRYTNSSPLSAPPHLCITVTWSHLRYLPALAHCPRPSWSDPACFSPILFTHTLWALAFSATSGPRSTPSF